MEKVCGELSLAVNCSHTLAVVRMGTVIISCAFGPLNTRLLNAEYDPNMAASKLTARLCCDWTNQQHTITSTAAL